MMMPSIFGENLFDDFMDDFSFPTLPDVDKELYGKHAKNLMKTDVKETDDGYQVAVDLPGFKKDEIKIKLENGTLTINAAKGLDKDEGKVNHMGTKAEDGKIMSTGGRVLFVVGRGATIPEAREAALRDVERIECDNLFHRSDIGHWALTGK